MKESIQRHLVDEINPLDVEKNEHNVKHSAMKTSPRRF